MEDFDEEIVYENEPEIENADEVSPPSKKRHTTSSFSAPPEKFTPRLNSSIAEDVEKGRIESGDMKTCFDILHDLMTHPTAVPFNTPVDWKAMDLWDYPTIVKQPLDLGTIKVYPFLRFSLILCFSLFFRTNLCFP